MTIDTTNLYQAKIKPSPYNAPLCFGATKHVLSSTISEAIVVTGNLKVNQGSYVVQTKLRQRGHISRDLSQASMQIKWKVCLHVTRTRQDSPSTKSSKQIGHCQQLLELLPHLCTRAFLRQQPTRWRTNEKISNKSTVPFKSRAAIRRKAIHDLLQPVFVKETMDVTSHLSAEFSTKEKR